MSSWWREASAWGAAPRPWGGAGLRQAGVSLAFAGIAWLLGAGAPPAAACDLSEPETGTVANVIDGETLRLTGGKVVRLIGAKARMPPLGWRGDDPWPLVDEAKVALESLVSGKEVEFRFGGGRPDRHGPLLAQVFVVSGGTRLWLQEELVAKGLARVYSLPDSRACIAELMAQEREAGGKRGGGGGAAGSRAAPA